MMRIGVVGGGQLARMMHQEAIALGLDVRYLVESPHDPVAAVSQNHTIGSAASRDDLRRFAAEIDVMTFDHEVVDLGALADLERAGCILRPGSSTFATVADKSRMRAALTAAGIPVPSHRSPADGDEAAAIVSEHGPQVLKRAHGGYDGRGTHFVDDPATARKVVDEIVADGGEVLAETRLELEAELAVIVVTRPNGDMIVYDPVGTVQVDGQCRRVDAPAPHSTERLDEARRLAVDAARTVGAVGVLAVELFLSAGRLLVNELAARPHNSGHHTLDGCVTSQFENHLRAVSDLPLGDPTPVAAVAITANVIGRDGDTDPRALIGVALGVDPGAHVHLYGKSPRFDRKLGHVTVCDDDRERAVSRVSRVVEALGGQEVPQ